jgi:hypothetical protein
MDDPGAGNGHMEGFYLGGRFCQALFLALARETKE